MKCCIHEDFLSKLGFCRVTEAQNHATRVYRFFNQKGHGFDVIFSEEFNVLTIEEFECNGAGGISYNNTIVGMFHIYSPDDLDFIFSRNVRLNYAFKTAKKTLVYR